MLSPAGQLEHRWNSDVTGTAAEFHRCRSRKLRPQHLRAIDAADSERHGSPVREDSVKVRQERAQQRDRRRAQAAAPSLGRRLAMVPLATALASARVSELAQLGARHYEPHTARTEIYGQGSVLLDADDPTEAVGVVSNLIPQGELLSRRRGGRGAEGTGGQVAPGRSAGWFHHYQYAPVRPLPATWVSQIPGKD
jgi:hypothetical protein